MKRFTARFSPAPYDVILLKRVNSHCSFTRTPIGGWSTTDKKSSRMRVVRHDDSFPFFDRSLTPFFRLKLLILFGKCSTVSAVTETQKFRLRRKGFSFYTRLPTYLRFRRELILSCSHHLPLDCNKIRDDGFHCLLKTRES